MDVTQLNDVLGNVFAEESTRVVFWNDPEQEFSSALSELKLDGVHVLHLNEVGALEAKIRIERVDPEGRYLLYSPR